MNENLKKHVYNLLQQTEKKYGFQIIFAGETGSRSYGLETENSDVDVKGFFMYTEDQYLSIQKLTSYVKLNHETKINKDVDVDLELVDIRKYLRDRCKNVILDESVIWLKTNNVYINLIPEELKNLLITSIQTPLFQIWSKINKYQQKFQLCQQKEDGLLVGKDILNSIVQSYQVIYITYIGDILELELNFQKSYDKVKMIISNRKQNNNNNQNSDEFLEYFDKMYQLGQVLFEQKKIDNKNKIHINDARLTDYFYYMKNFILKEQPQERNNFDLLKSSNEIFKKFVNTIVLKK